MTRRSSALSVDDVDVDDSTVSPAVEEEVVSEPVQKRSKVESTATPIQGKSLKVKGSLGAFSELPLDVVSDIASQGDMGTVLSLSRLNRSLRSFLTSKRVAGVWEQARVNSELPELKAKKAPTVMQYADLMFGTRCMACGSGQTRAPIYGLYLRLCSPCYNLNIRWDHSVTTPIRISWHDHRGQPRQPYATFIADAERYETLPSGERKEQEDYFATEAQHHREDELAMAEWNVKRGEQLAADREKRKEQRKLTLQAHFRALGWTKRSVNSPAFVEHPKVNTSRELTESTIDGVYSALIKILESERERVEAANAVEDAKLEKKQLEESQASRKGLVKTALLSLVSNEQAQKDAGIWPLPNLDECLNFESVKLLYEPKDAHDEPDVKGSYSSIAAELDELRDKLKAELFDKHSRSLASFDSRHSYLNRDRRDESIVPHLPTPQGADGTYTFEQKEAVLALATTVLDCRDRHDYPYQKQQGCKSVAPWPYIFHECRYSTKHPSLRATSYEVSSRYRNVAAWLVRTADLDPATATSADMEALGNVFSCENCRHASLDSVARSFRQALRHFSVRHYIGAMTLDDLKVVCESEELAVARLIKVSKEHSEV